MSQIIECIPNISEGLNTEVLDKITAAITKFEDVKLIHKDIGASANRTVFTFVGPPQDVCEAAFNMYKVARELIDMRNQKGEHPRIGAIDVCPLVPVKNISMEETSGWARLLAKSVGENLNIPVFCYESSAYDPHKRNLADIRKGGYEGMERKMSNPLWQSDFGPLHFNPKTGVTVIGARFYLIAFNVNLTTTDVTIAKKIALQIRQSSFTPYTLLGVKAIGWSMKQYNNTQVSTNIVDYRKSNPAQVYEQIKSLAREYGTDVNGSELIGLIPKEALVQSGLFYTQKKNIHQNEQIETAVEKLGLNTLKPFDPQIHILESHLE